MKIPLVSHTPVRDRQARTPKEASLFILLVSAALLVRIGVMVSLPIYRFPTERSVGYEMGWIARNLIIGFSRKWICGRAGRECKPD